jgi:beta-galactosidase
MPLIEFTENDTMISIHGENINIAFSKTKGILTSYLFNQTNLLTHGPKPDFWRPPTDNDLGNGIPIRCGAWKNAWEKAMILDVEAKQNNNQSIKITTRSLLPELQVVCNTLYTIYGSGDILVEHEVFMDDKSLPEIPRLGMIMTLPGGFVNVKWYGRGPHESYWDRKTGAPVGLHEGTVWEQHHPYVRPQENGNKTDVRWMAVYNDHGVGLMVSGFPGISTCVRQYERDLLEHPGKGKPNRHLSDIQPGDIVTWNIDYRQMGVGGDNSWGARTHPAYTLYPANYKYRFRLKPFDLMIDDPEELYKDRF